MSGSVRHSSSPSADNLYPSAAGEGGLGSQSEAGSSNIDEDDFPTSSVSPAVTGESANSGETSAPKRRRGRPRKEPPSEPQEKQVKKRTKTGCFTCRARKKKCDETKPTCQNCRNANVVCEGYPDNTSPDRKKEKFTYGSSERSRRLPLFLEGVEDDLDRKLLGYFLDRVSSDISPFSTGRNRFIDLLVIMARKYVGVMHSLLCLSASILSKERADTATAQREMHHFAQALHLLRTDKTVAAHNADSTIPIGDSVLTQTFLLCLKCIGEGDTSGTHKKHLSAGMHAILQHPTRESEICSFIGEFFLSFSISNTITSAVQSDSLTLEAVSLLTVDPSRVGNLFVAWDGLSTFVLKISQFRSKVRSRRQQGIAPAVAIDELREAYVIDQEIVNLESRHPPGSLRHAASLLYHQCIRLYLRRTACPARPDKGFSELVDSGLGYVQELLSDASSYPILLMPLFLLGCCAFEDDQRASINSFFRLLLQQRCFRNVLPATTVVEKIWEMMDAKDEGNWDWETVMKQMGLDFLVI